MGDDEAARRRRAERLREEAEAAGTGAGPPRTPREFTERAAREAAEAERADSDEPRADDSEPM